MPDQKISDLSAAGAITGTELIPIVQGGNTLNTTPNAIKTFINPIKLTESFVLSGVTQVISFVPLFVYGYYIDGVFCVIGGRITSLVSKTITTDADYTGSTLTVVYEH